LRTKWREIRGCGKGNVTKLLRNLHNEKSLICTPYQILVLRVNEEG
jgi:hypothetical protein